jgi:signal transduction histidine kinase
MAARRWLQRPPGLAPRTHVAIAAVVLVAHAVLFPVELSYTSDIFLEGLYLVLVVGMAVYVRELDIPTLEFGWMVFVHARFIDFLDELFAEANPWVNPYFGGVVTVLGLGILVFGLRNAVETRRRRVDRLKRSNERLEQFASVVSHDLRNPVTVARGHLQMLGEDAADEHVEPIERSLSRMEAMIEDLLAVARAEKTIDDLEPVTVSTVAREAWSHAETGDATLDLAVPEGATVPADRDSLLHIFENLFRNAVAHNDAPVTVRVVALDETEPVPDGGQLSGLYVADDGGGIPAEKRDDVFEYGYTTAEDGTGFGLAIVEDVAKAQDWEVSVRDSADGGARFELVAARTGN